MEKREIKFRAWDDNSKKWLDTFMLWSDTGKVVSVNHAYGNIHVMQYTGLKDKNGKEIYEGDILGYWSKATWTVGWDNKKSKYVAIYDYGDTAFGLSDSVIRGKKIIGNIYQNPELLS